ncbi:MAG: LCP family protein [Clostridia bacterium]|nr:LCP family protein [Clostridia bacterium]
MSEKRFSADSVLTLAAGLFGSLAIIIIAAFIVFGAVKGGDVPAVNRDVPAADDDKKSDYHTYLVAGLDKISNNTDVLMLVSVDGDAGSINVLQIPRDTFISRAVTKFTNVSRVNGIYPVEYNYEKGLGYSSSSARKLAMRSLCDRLQDAFGIIIDDWVLFTTESFRSVIDAIGGVWFDVPVDMFYEDPEQDLYIDLKAGYQLLDGNAAEQLIRFRKYANADIGRTSVRGDFIKETFRQTKANMSVGTVIKLLPELIGDVYTSVSVGDAISVAGTVFGMQSDEIAVRTISGSSVEDPATGRWSACYYLNRDSAYNDINTLMNPYKDDIADEKFDTYGLFVDRDNTIAYDYYYRKTIIQEDTE